tara:strand:+ start:756 stop:1175 length:420 start_codon:yes stop_codon:yes gene_type:complete
MLKEVRELTWQQTIGAVFGFMGAISPGFLLLYIFKPELVDSLATIKLIVFSLSLSMPMFIVNLFIITSLYKEFESSNDYFGGAAIALFLTSVATYPILLFTYLYPLNFKEFLVALAAAEICVAIFVFVSSKLDSKGKNA